MASIWQRKIIDKYESMGYYVIKLITTNKAGIPDLLCLKKGELPTFIECKEKNDTLKVLQKFRLDELRSAGCIAKVMQDGKDNLELI